MDGLKVLGGPYGSAAFAGRALTDRAAAHESLTDFAVEIADTGQRHAAIRLLQTAASRRHPHLARALDPEVSLPLLTQADAMNETAMLFTLDVDVCVTVESEKENLDILLQRLHHSTDYGDYNLIRQAEERHVAHYASLNAILHPLHELMLKHAPNRFVDHIRHAIAQPDPTQPDPTSGRGYLSLANSTSVLSGSFNLRLVRRYECDDSRKLRPSCSKPATTPLL